MTPLPFGARSWGPRTQSSHSIAFTPFLATLSCSLSRKQLHHSDPRSAAIPLGPPMRRYASFARDATAGRLYSGSLFLSSSLTRSLIHPRSLTPSLSFCAFSLTPSNFFLIVFVVSLLSRSLASYLPPPPFSSSSNTHVMRPTRARESPACATQHTWPVRPLLLAECAVLPPAGDRVTWPPGRNGTQRAARAVLSREPRTRHQSETNRETGPTDRILSPRKRVWCFLSPSLSLSDSFFFSLPFYLFFSHTLSLNYNSLLSSSLSALLFFVTCATYHPLGPLVCAPTLSLPSDVSAATCQFPSVVCLRAVASVVRPATNREGSLEHWDIFVAPQHR